MSNSLQELSIYVHWPFCKSLCPYCDFNSHLEQDIDIKSWIKAYETELHYFSDRINGRRIRSIFFGGGTPSLMPINIIYSIIDNIAKLGKIDEYTEITLESNPTSYEKEKFSELKHCGINRISIGVQSFDDEELKFLGRKHSSNEAKFVIEHASSIFPNVSFDLIYALPNQTLDKWKESLISAIEIASGHISLYQLTIEKGTEFFSLYKRGNLKPLDEEVSLQMYEWTNDYLTFKGYNRYEISNYSTPGKESIHNLAYWRYKEYIGIGAGAHSRLHDKEVIKAIMMVHEPKKWLNNVLKSGHAIQNSNILSLNEKIAEFMIMGTRLMEGIKISDLLYLSKTNLESIFNMKSLENLCNLGLLEFDSEKLKVTNKGIPLQNYLLKTILSE